MSKVVVQPMCRSCTKSCMVGITGSPLVIMASKGYRGCSLVIEVGLDE